MKFTNKQYPILEKITSGKAGAIGFYDGDAEIIKDDIFFDFLRKDFKGNLPIFKNHVRYITLPFSSAISSSFDSLIRDEIWNNIESQSGTILNLPTFMGPLTACYSISQGERIGHHIGLVFYFLRDKFIGTRIQSPSLKYSITKGLPITPFQCAYSGVATKIFSKLWSDTGLPDSSSQYELINEMDNLLYSSLVATLNFIKYAQVETKHLAEGQRIKDIECKYINETPCKIEILNSTWFTNLIKSDSFKVRGHFRLQPCGEGMKQRKLIWINEFQKEGYTAKARILCQSNS